jgi:Zn-dependent protease with chaperone function
MHCLRNGRFCFHGAKRLFFIAVETGPVIQPIDRLSHEIGTAAPDHVIVGIDDTFFVTEHPVAIQGARCKGRTLFVSLSLLRTMPEDERTAVLAHELAHFSGYDTTPRPILPSA